MDHVRDCKINVLSQCDLINEAPQIKFLYFIDDLSLMVIDGGVENLFPEMKNLTVSLLQMLCLEKLV